MMKKQKLFAAIFFIVIAIACNRQQKHANDVITSGVDTASAIRYGMITGVKPEKLDYYKQLHAAPWPKVIEKIGECNIHNYSIYLQKIEERYYLFSYFEYTGKDFDGDMKKMAADTTTQRWWKETDPCQLPLAEALAKHQVWTSMQEVFYSK